MLTPDFLLFSYSFQSAILITRLCLVQMHPLQASIINLLLLCVCVSLQLTDGGKAARAKMSVGDIILSINGISTDGMNHLEAQNKIKACTGQLSLTLQR